MANKQLVHLRIEVPEDVEVVPLVVHTRGLKGVASPEAGHKMIKFNLTSAKAAKWLRTPGPRANDCCCVRGFM